MSKSVSYTHLDVYKRQAFYAKPDLRNVRPPEEPAKSEPATLDLESLVAVSYTHLPIKLPVAGFRRKCPSGVTIRPDFQ